MKKALIFFILTFLIGCSAIQENEGNKEPEKQNVYVFDDVSSADTTANVATEVPEKKNEEETETVFRFFIVQVGAFSTQEKAETFVKDVAAKTSYEMNVHKNNENGLYVVQLNPFRTKAEAEKVRDELKVIKEFNGAWIVVPSNNK